MFKKLTLTLLLCALFLTQAGAAFAAETASAPKTWTVSVGKSVGSNVLLFSMFPNTLFIHEGDTVVFKNEDVAAPHTVTFWGDSEPVQPDDSFMAPSVPSGSDWDGTTMINSGLFVPSQDYSIRFTASGVYPYLCLLHPNMTGSIVVIPKDRPIPSQSQQEEALKQVEADRIHQAEHLAAAHGAPSIVRDADGTFTYQVQAGLDGSDFMINRFLPQTVFITEGDSVEWSYHGHDAHVIVFNLPSDMPAMTPEGPNPALMVPTGGPSFDGKEFATSGALYHGAEPFKLTFEKAGTYTYEDAMFSTEDQPMIGQVIVAPKGSVRVTVNGEALTTTSKAPYVKNNRVYVPLVETIKAIGGEVKWNAASKAVIVNVDGVHQTPKTLKTMSNGKIVVNGKQWIYTADSAPQQVNGKTYVSAQDLATLLNGTYTWDEITKGFDLYIEN